MFVLHLTLYGVTKRVTEFSKRVTELKKCDGYDKEDQYGEDVRPGSRGAGGRLMLEWEGPAVNVGVDYYEPENREPAGSDSRAMNEADTCGNHDAFSQG
jgi:hypothetical protein